MIAIQIPHPAVKRMASRIATGGLPLPVGNRRHQLRIVPEDH